MPFERHAWFRNRYTEPSIVLYNSHKSYIWLWKLSVLLNHASYVISFYGSKSLIRKSLRSVIVKRFHKSINNNKITTINILK
ncbi:unnamed protein product [Rotaria socialis]